MQDYFKQLSDAMHAELQVIDLEGCDISIEESISMVEFFKKGLSDLRSFLLAKESMPVEDEITFFKEMKPEVLGRLLYFHKIHNIELNRPTGSNDTQKEYYENKLSNITYFFERHLDFYQYYRTKATYMDEYYFVRGKLCPKLCADSMQYIHDPLFSTVYDYKVAKIICNEMLRIYLNKRMLGIDKQTIINKNRASLPANNLHWTGPKVALVEFGYSFESSGYVNNGNADIKEIMIMLEIMLNIDLGDYYRTYISIKDRKIDRTKYLNIMIEKLIKRMDEDDSI
jgi:hypothetical protein